MSDKPTIHRHSEKWPECALYVLSRTAHVGNKNSDPISIVKSKYNLLKIDEEYLKLLIFLKIEFFEESCDLEILKGHVDKEDMPLFESMAEAKEVITSISTKEIDDMLSVLD